MAFLQNFGRLYFCLLAYFHGSSGISGVTDEYFRNGFVFTPERREFGFTLTPEQLLAYTNDLIALAYAVDLDKEVRRVEAMHDLPRAYWTSDERLALYSECQEEIRDLLARLANGKVPPTSHWTPTAQHLIDVGELRVSLTPSGDIKADSAPLPVMLGLTLVELMKSTSPVRVTRCPHPPLCDQLVANRLGGNSGGRPVEHCPAHRTKKATAFRFNYYLKKKKTVKGKAKAK